jgi:hypothetical protein
MFHPSLTISNFAQYILKRIRSILLKGLFYFMALQTLNLSVDIDYIVGSLPRLAAMVNYDDIDSITELVVENVIGDVNYTSEEDDDGGAQNKGSEKIDYELYFFDPPVKAPVIVKAVGNNGWVRGMDIANRTCKGYYNITSPPPEG